MITLIHGPAELLRAETLDAIRSSIAADAEMAELNTTRLDGRQTTVAALQNACDTMPFLAEHRLVVAEGLLARLAAPAKGRGKGMEQSEGAEGARGGSPLARRVQGTDQSAAGLSGSSA